MRLGVRIQAEVGCGITSTKSRHHEAKAYGVALKLKPQESFNKEKQALSNAYLKTEGLYSLRDGCFLH